MFLIYGCSGLPVTSREAPPDSAASGITYSAVVDTTGPWVIHVVRADVRTAGLSVESARAGPRIPARETTSSMARRFRQAPEVVEAAINADFFEPDGVTVSGQVSRGAIIQALRRRTSAGRPPVVRSQFAITAGGRPVIEQFTFEGNAIFEDGTSRPISAVNLIRHDRGVVVFNADGNGRSPADSIGFRELTLRTVATVADTEFTVVAAPGVRSAPDSIFPGTIVLRWLPDSVDLASSLVETGDTVAIVTGFRPDRGRLRTLVGGMPRIVLDGRNVAGLEGHREGSSADFSSRRHPRSGVGFTRDSSTIVFITVDGRQAASVGMSLPEFADLMIARGVYQGLNLDGGGSTTMVIRDTVVNVPSDLTGERPVANCLLILRRPGAPPGAPTEDLPSPRH